MMVEVDMLSRYNQFADDARARDTPNDSVWDGGVKVKLALPQLPIHHQTVTEVGGGTQYPTMLAHKASRARTVWEINPALSSNREGASRAAFDINVSAQFESRSQWNGMALQEQGATQQPYTDYERWPEQITALGYVDWIVVDVDSQWTNKETEVL